MLRTLGKTTWDEIEVGEVFAASGCWRILFKRNKTGVIHLSNTYNSMIYPEGIITKGEGFPTAAESLYKLPLSVQRLWINP